MIRLDKLQDGFLRELGISPEEAFIEFNFAPVSLRRDIGILGMLHKRVVGQAHPIFQRLFPFHRDVFGELPPNKHSRALYYHYMEVCKQINLYHRSIFAMVGVYNIFSQNLVDCSTVREFQSCLTAEVKDLCQQGSPQWRDYFSSRR